MILTSQLNSLRVDQSDKSLLFRAFKKEVYDFMRSYLWLKLILVKN